MVCSKAAISRTTKVSLWSVEGRNLSERMHCRRQRLCFYMCQYSATKYLKKMSLPATSRVVYMKYICVITVKMPHLKVKTTVETWLSDNCSSNIIHTFPKSLHILSFKDPEHFEPEKDKIAIKIILHVHVNSATCFLSSSLAVFHTTSGTVAQLESKNLPNILSVLQTPTCPGSCVPNVHVVHAHAVCLASVRLNQLKF